MTEFSEDERIILIGFLTGVVVREANQKGEVEVSSENIESLMDLFGLDAKLSSKEELLVEFLEAMTFKIGFGTGSNRNSRRWKLKSNKSVYKLQ